MELTIKRGDIYYAELNPVIGSEQGGTRPVLIISNDIGNKHSPTVIIAPITSRVHTKAKLPTHTLIKDFDGLDKNSIDICEQTFKLRVRHAVALTEISERCSQLAIRTSVLSDYKFCESRVGICYLDRILQLFLINKHAQPSFFAQ